MGKEGRGCGVRGAAVWVRICWRRKGDVVEHEVGPCGSQPVWGRKGEVVGCEGRPCGSESVGEGRAWLWGRRGV